MSQPRHPILEASIGGLRCPPLLLQVSQSAVTPLSLSAHNPDFAAWLSSSFPSILHLRKTLSLILFSISLLFHYSLFSIGPLIKISAFCTIGSAPSAHTRENHTQRFLPVDISSVLRRRQPLDLSILSLSLRKSSLSCLDR
ncbi:hypothetical protein P175DRAFT_0528900 [Aspergillus ochraceoroseus IBT 24754]|uniref:Uncharacterized protein n=1 Tax=Aspergillus ochraceoroseus IBT 24754 TaxID=1392256 RepID=A0A2T5M9Y5_9EURO|nr:uncharacterized protein P175DRAFT_0528900 [Aspergillus ochraceoroseus IBT 24754]PTU25352.1 hypothetical protein P175DRAFT_0528900 [Aspergillus ochraceoroseus IBT 24754]